MTKPHGNTGRRNAAKDEKLDAHLHIRVSKKDKAQWQAKAQAEGMKLQPWVIEQLNLKSQRE